MPAHPHSRIKVLGWLKDNSDQTLPLEEVLAVLDMHYKNFASIKHRLLLEELIAWDEKPPRNYFRARITEAGLAYFQKHTKK